MCKRHIALDKTNALALPTRAKKKATSATEDVWAAIFVDVAVALFLFYFVCVPIRWHYVDAFNLFVRCAKAKRALNEFLVGISILHALSLHDSSFAVKSSVLLRTSLSLFTFVVFRTHLLYAIFALFASAKLFVWDKRDLNISSAKIIEFSAMHVCDLVSSSLRHFFLHFFTFIFFCWCNHQPVKCLAEIVCCLSRNEV